MQYIVLPTPSPSERRISQPYGVYSIRTRLLTTYSTVQSRNVCLIHFYGDYNPCLYNFVSDSVRDIQLSPSLHYYPPEKVITCTARGDPSPTFKWQKKENDAIWMD